jgi:Fe2+ or Zn2+ uptake regulation protein
MQFLPFISNEKRFKSFKRLSQNEEVLTEISKIYATLSNLDESETIQKINHYNSEFFSSRTRIKTGKNKK